jgi:pyrimidine operon attenuation protein / uracil phosphoribosyltransferase
MSQHPQRLLLDKAAMARAVNRLAEEICQGSRGNGTLALIGIRKRGVPLAQRLAAAMKSKPCAQVQVGSIDITQYRDDLSLMKMVPELTGSDIPFDIDDAHVILCDEVIYTGRSVRAALDELLDHGRPAKVELAVLIDREGREFPVQPTYSAMKVAIPASERVSVRFEEVDDEDTVFVQSSPPAK